MQKIAINERDKQTIATLKRRIANAPDFGYDDEAIELTELLKVYGKAWRWGKNSRGNEVVAVYDIVNSAEEDDI